MIRRGETTTDAAYILREMFIGDDPDRLESLRGERENLYRAGQIYGARRRAGPSHAEVAERAATTQSVISRLEDAGCNGYSLNMLHRNARALNCKLQVNFVPQQTRRSPTKRTLTSYGLPGNRERFEHVEST